MEIFFITGNKHKVEEVQALIPSIQQLNIDLPEIQSLDPKEIVAAKLKEARKHHTEIIVVEDVSFVVDGLHGLPGPLIKWFLTAVGAEGIYKLTQSTGTYSAHAIATVGLMSTDNQILYFTGQIDGQVVPPRGTLGFAGGWDPIFQPNGFETTFAEMLIEEKSKISHRALAWKQLSNFLQI